MTWLNDLNNQNQKQLGNYVQNLNEGNSGGNWLQKTQESNIQKISQPSEVMKWLGDTSKNVMENIQDQESLVWKGPEGVNEALKTLAWQAVTFMPSIALGTGRIAYEKGRNLTVPEDKQISSKGIYRKAMRDASYLPGLIEPPKTSTGKAIVKPVEKFFHWAFTVPRNIGKDMGEFYGPNIGWLSEQALTLGMLKVTHAAGSELHSGIRKITKQARVRKANSPRMKSKAEELDQLLKNINKSKQSSRYDAEFEKKVNEFESIIQAEMQFEADLFMENQAELAKRGPAIMPQEIQRPKGVPKPPPKQIPEPIQKIMNFARVAKERMEKDRIDNPILSDVIETSKRGKFDTIDLKSLRLKNERRMGKLKEKQYVKDKVEDNIESRRPDLRNTEDAEAYGFQATPEQIKDLEYFRDQSLKIQKDLKKAGDINGAFYEAQMGQFYREALEMQKGVPEKSLMDTLKEKKPITEAE